MNDKGVGAIFCLISSILISAKYLSAAIFVSNKDAILFSASLEYVGSFLTIASLIALIIGLLFLGLKISRSFFYGYT